MAFCSSSLNRLRHGPNSGAWKRVSPWAGQEIETELMGRGGVCWEKSGFRMGRSRVYQGNTGSGSLGLSPQAVEGIEGLMRS